MLSSVDSRILKRQLRGFLFGSVLNFSISYLCYALLCLLLHYQLAYFIAYVVGISWSYWFNTTHVFRVDKSFRTFCIYPAVYASQYIASHFILWGVVEIVGLHRLAAPILTAVATFPLTFILSKLVFQHTTQTKKHVTTDSPVKVS